MHAAEMRRCLLEVDVPGIRALWAHVSPNMPQPKGHVETLAAIHHARTQSEWAPMKARAYSHRWLIDHDFPSGLPDRLKARAERIYPTVVDGVGVIVGFTSPLFAPIKPIVVRAMCDAVEDCYANGEKSPEIVRPRMLEAKATAVRQLLGVHQ